RERGKFVEHILARVDAGDVAVEMNEHVDQRVAHCPRAKDPHPPFADVVRLEIELHRAAAGHADVLLQAPLREYRGLRVRAGEHPLCLGDRFGLNLAAADRAELQPLGGDDHLPAALLRPAAGDGDDGDRDQGDLGRHQLVQRLEESRHGSILAMRRVTLALILLAACSRAPGGNMNLASPAFGNNQSIPAKFTCTSQDVSPPLQWNGVPSSAKSLELTVDDPDAPGGHFTHWQITQIPPTTSSIPEGGHVGVEGPNDFGKQGYGGPCPPSGEHRYVFTLKALDADGREVGRGQLIGKYRK